MIRFGIIGTNWITDSFLTAAGQHPDFQLTAVYSRTQEKASEFAAKYGVSLTFTSLEEMAKSDAIDAVYIASPNSHHAEQAILLMENKKHVLCEKPIASNARELRKMIETAKEHNVLLMEALKTTFLPNFQAIKSNIHKIGQVRRFFASYCQYSSRYDAYKEGTILNAFKPEFSNGSLMDIGVYCLYPAVALFGKPLEVKASGLLLETGVDAQGSLVLKYEDKEVLLMFSKITNSFVQSEVQGEEGIIVFDKLNPPEDVKIRYRNGEVEDIAQEQVNHPMFYETKEFIELLQNGKRESSINSYEVSLQVMEILDEARKQMGVVYPSDLK
ncbi:Gfo/Idh/MocA family oxidoreductase [Robertmurraya yapensis]|uniref:Gfo/Idh/MocA family oxidoreductase n=2 Tax=Bacillaceae TaxID=186817 RepID=A0A3S0RGK1_9BACI|nr:Gfo/Idh/MocA family oxidoreductase [Bacillus yapensis]RTR27870.1 Gfo/Idh/MocA family oxidoreductase [Bacillus yapensis]TKS94273.1 Gfo/Idh/MocA family oxidoreductase [Bacillus yapensis]